jgi:hypothetical protein
MLPRKAAEVEHSMSRFHAPETLQLDVRSAADTPAEFRAFIRDETLTPATSSWPGIAVRRTASLRLPMSRPSTSCLLTIQQVVDARHKAGMTSPRF